MRMPLVAAYPWVLLVVGLLGTTLGVDRTFKSKEDESRLLMGLGLIGGIAMLALPTLVVVRGADYGIAQLARCAVLDAPYLRHKAPM